MEKYEQEQHTQIEQWKKQEPWVISRYVEFALKPVIWLVSLVIPNKAIQGALMGSNWIGEKLSDTADILKEASVQSLDQLESCNLETLDRISNSVHNWAIGLAVAEGGVTGFFGLPGMVVDIPTIITFAMRTIHKIGLCYGFECKTPEERQIIFSILAAAGANSIEEKSVALATLQALKVTLAKATWKSMHAKVANELAKKGIEKIATDVAEKGVQKIATDVAEKGVQKIATDVAEKGFQKALTSKEGAILAVKNLAQKLGINLTKRKALQAIPAIGGVVGASVNGVYIHDIGWAARRIYQDLWLKRKYDQPHDKAA